VQDLQRETIDIPEWGGAVNVRALTIAEGEAIGFAVREARRRGEDTGSFSARLAAASIVDDNGNRIFTDADIVPLSRKSASAMQRIAEAIQRLSGIGPTAVEEAAKK
jgi:hypothetical protein